MVATGPHRTFAILDVVGITTAYNINKMEAEKQGIQINKSSGYLKEHFIDKGNWVSLPAKVLYLSQSCVQRR
jgi:3-hydroxybutyryl-CoA dehydrogenase